MRRTLLWLILLGGLVCCPAAAQTSTVDVRLHDLLAHDLTAEAAVQIALLRNPQVQVIYADVGVSEADLVAAGVLKNPLFDAYVRFPDHPGLTTNTQFEVSVDFLDIFLRAARRNNATARLAQTQFEVAYAVARLTREVKAACYTLQESQQALALQQVFTDAAHASAELAQRQQDAGTANALDVARQQAAAAQADVDLARLHADVSVARRTLAGLMGVTGSNWNTVATLPPLPPAEPDLATLEAQADKQRQDLAAARLEPAILTQRVSLERWLSLGEVRLGVSRERESEGFTVTGPTLQLALPIFNQGQGTVRTLEAQRVRATQQVAQLELEVQTEVGNAYDRLQAQRRAVEAYQQKLVPLRRHIVALEHTRYNAMLSGVYTLLAARQDEIEALRVSLEALRDYWTARADLERAVGGRW